MPQGCIRSWFYNPNVAVNCLTISALVPFPARSFVELEQGGFAVIWRTRFDICTFLWRKPL